MQQQEKMLSVLQTSNFVLETKLSGKQSSSDMEKLRQENLQLKQQTDQQVTKLFGSFNVTNATYPWRLRQLIK
jgi:hypothetical protein